MDIEPKFAHYYDTYSVSGRSYNVVKTVDKLDCGGYGLASDSPTSRSVSHGAIEVECTDGLTDWTSGRLVTLEEALRLLYRAAEHGDYIIGYAIVGRKRGIKIKPVTKTRLNKGLQKGEVHRNDKRYSDSNDSVTHTVEFNVCTTILTPNSDTLDYNTEQNRANIKSIFDRYEVKDFFVK